MRSHTTSLLSRNNLLLDEYQDFAVSTDKSGRFGADRLQFMLLGLFGEVGSLLSELKKKQRDTTAYQAYAQSAHEETGDVLWYLSNVADALGLRLSALVDLPDASDARPVPGTAPSSHGFHALQGQQSLFEEPASTDHVQKGLLKVAARAGRLVHRASAGFDETDIMRSDLARIFSALVTATTDAHISLNRAARENVLKILDRWPIERNYTALFDDRFDSDEQLPRRLEVTFREKEVRGVKYVFQSVHGINIGDRLTDNSADEDDYRFHDAFHLSFAAILGWSPVLRALLRLKRKSDKDIDEQQDGARAIIAEEGLSNWIFAHGLRHRAFEGAGSVDFALLRTVRQMVSGYEVEACPLWMWEEAILQGFEVFRQLKVHRGGLVVADLQARTLTFQPADPS